MGVIVELVRARQRIVLLEAELARVQVPLPVPTERKVVTGEDIYNIIRTYFPQGEIFLSDSYSQPVYSLCDIADIEAFLDMDETNHIKYVAERFDCDNFARLLWGQLAQPAWAGYAIGLFWSNTHAMVACIDANEDMWLIEPQTDERRSNLLDWQGTFMRFIIM